ncbi:MAG TPA: DUF6691 family protein [Bacteroidia bacterium]|nr:DUF6691 family protein [Bacteroidia bacterium]
MSDEFAEQDEANGEIDYIKNIKFIIVGIFFGITLVKAEMMSWFRIQEMFRFSSFHMYGIMGTAVITGIISVWLIKRFKVKTISGEEIKIEPKQFNKGQIYGGLLFGLGWALTGACPGPLIAQIGSGFTVMAVGFFSAIFGAWMYAYLKDKLPH